MSDREIYEYRCCCRLLHVKTATWMVAFAELILCVCALGVCIYSAIWPEEGKRDDYWYTGYITMGILVIFILLTLLLMYALHTRNANLVIPHLIASVLIAIWWLVRIVLVLISSQSLWQIFCFIGFACLIVVCAMVEYLTWKYLKEHRLIDQVEQLYKFQTDI